MGTDAVEPTVSIDPSVEKLVFVSDLHAFTEPLEVLDQHIDAMDHRVQVLAVGDLVVGGVQPAEVVHWVRRRVGGLGVRGNHDRGTSEPGRGDELGREVRYVIKHKLLVTPEVEIVGYGELPRSERKSQRVFDTRITDQVVEGVVENS